MAAANFLLVVYSQFTSLPTIRQEHQKNRIYCQKG